MPNQKPASAKLLSCPGCEKKNFQTIPALRMHFIAKGHSASRCRKCQKTFNDVLSLIQHYQKYTISTDPPALVQVSAKAKLDNAPSPARKQEKAEVVVATAHSAETLKEVSKDPKSSTTRPSRVPLPAVEDYVVVEHPVVEAATLPSSILPISLTPEEQEAVSRSLSTRCHPPKRLLAEGYIIEGGTVKNKEFVCNSCVPLNQFRDTPRPSEQSAPKRRAVAIDCEMVEIANHRQALAFLSAIDALTGEVLISRLVQPSERVLHWRTRHSGVTASLMSKAVASGEAVKNWKTARQMLWALVDSETVLIGHSLKHDLQVLGMRHPKIVDSAILTAEAVFPDPLVTGTMTRLWSLKKLAKAFLGADIQVGKNGHAALEDAFASRDIVVQCIRRPAQLEEWAKRMRVEEKDRQIAREIQRKLKAAQKLEGDKKPELGRADRKGTRRKQTKPNLKVVGRAKGLAQT